MSAVKERFLRYVKMDTTANPDHEHCPSSEGQLLLAKELVDEMKAIGLEHVVLDAHGYVYGEIPATSGYEKAPKLAFIAHMDTSPDLSGKNVNPRVVESYDGGDVVLNEEKQIVLSPNDFDHLKHYVGQDLIVTDGTTLLGADNKAGIAEILTLCERIIGSKDFKHGPIKIAFTPDEEIGRGADLFDLKQLDADFGYTVDGGEIGEIEFENFRE